VTRPVNGTLAPGYDAHMRVVRGLLATLVFLSGPAAASERLLDPIRAFVEGYDPSGNDFLANVPERTVLLRIRADLDGDGIEDLALSDSSTWGNAGGQWLLFRGQPDKSFVYWGTIFLSPGTAVVRPVGRGESELLLYVRTSVSRGMLEAHRVTSSAITRLSQVSLDLERPRDRERYEAVLRSRGKLAVEHCKLLEYRREAASCWRPGLGLR
jgi:hypothetical protein